MRAYTVSLDLARFDAQHWQTQDAAMDLTPALPGTCVRGRCAAGASVADALDRLRTVRLITPRMAARLLPVDPLTLRAGLLGSNPDGLFKVGDTKP